MTDITHFAVLVSILGRTKNLCGDKGGFRNPDPWKVTCLPCLKAGRFDLHPRDVKGRFMKTARHINTQ